MQTRAKKVAEYQDAQGYLFSLSLSSYPVTASSITFVFPWIASRPLGDRQGQRSVELNRIVNFDGRTTSLELVGLCLSTADPAHDNAILSDENFMFFRQIAH